MSYGVRCRCGWIWRCCGCGIGWQLQLQSNPLAWESSCAAGAALKRKRRERERRSERFLKKGKGREGTDDGEDEQDAGPALGLGEQEEKPSVLTKMAMRWDGGQFRCQSTPTPRSFLLPLWIQSTQEGQPAGVRRTGTRNSSFTPQPGAFLRKKRCQTNP